MRYSYDVAVVGGAMAGASTAYLLETGAYFIGPVRQAYGDHPHKYSELPYGGPIGQLFGSLMRSYNRRLAKLAKRKMRAGTYGASNLDSRLFLPGASSFSCSKVCGNGWKQSAAICFFARADLFQQNCKADKVRGFARER